jgi:Bacterial extracellular solute-binding proteins, family 5 Middle
LSAADIFRAIRGIDRCHLRRCNLAAGIVADDVDRTISFRLSAPDPYFLYKLTSTFAAPVPGGTSLQEATRRPLPATGPYRIASFTGDSVRLARNPYFQEWSEAAQPDGFPDEIVLKAVSAQRGIALVEQGKADLTSTFPLEPFSVAPRFVRRSTLHRGGVALTRGACAVGGRPLHLQRAGQGLPQRGMAFPDSSGAVIRTLRTLAAGDKPHG